MHSCITYCGFSCMINVFIYLFIALGKAFDFILLSCYVHIFGCWCFVIIFNTLYAAWIIEAHPFS